jgi:hypothetical protein
LYVGKTVEIPLYYEDSSGAVTKLDFAALNDEEFRLRVRTPACSGGPPGCDNNRLILYPLVTSDDYRNPDKDPVLIQWSIFDAGGDGVITAWDKRDENDDDKRLMTADREQNTEISSGRINLANVFGVMSELDDDRLENFQVLQYLNNSINPYEKHRGKNRNNIDQSIGDAIFNYTKPTLRLALIDRPQRNIASDGTSYSAAADPPHKFDVPYLEYQLLTKQGSPTDAKTLIVGWAEIGGFRKEIRKYIKRQAPVSGFAIESF